MKRLILLAFVLCCVAVCMGCSSKTPDEAIVSEKPKCMVIHRNDSGKIIESWNPEENQIDWTYPSAVAFTLPNGEQRIIHDHWTIIYHASPATIKKSLEETNAR